MIVHGNATARVDIAVAIRIRTGLLLQLDIGPALVRNRSAASHRVLAVASYGGCRLDSQNLTAPKPSRFAGVMDKFKLEPIRIGKEHGIVPGAVCWIFGWRIEDGRFLPHQKLVQTVYVGAVYRMPS